MTQNRFVWADLSTFDMKQARTQYAGLFGWAFGGDRSYDFALEGAEPVAAIFPMPAKLAALNLPSFWMSYIRVQGLDAMVDKARQHEGVIIEVAPEPFGEDARVALVRDPSGAGFTLYEGPDIAVPAGPGRVMARYHHLPDVELIRAFYADLFGWRFEPVRQGPWGAGWPAWDIHHADGDVIARVEEVPEDVRGKYRYWMPCFGSDMSGDQLAEIGFTVLSDLGQGRRIVSDDQGASLMLAPARR